MTTNTETTTTTLIDRSTTGRLTVANTLAVDAAGSGAAGAVLALGGAPLADAFGIPLAWTTGVGIFFLGFALSLLLIRHELPAARPLVGVVAVGNLAWVALSAVTVVAGWWAPTGLGSAIIVAQAVFVLVVAELQITALRR